MGTLSENIKAARVAAKMTQEELANRLGTTKSAVSRYEKGKREPALAQIAQIASVLNVKFEDLVSVQTFSSPEDFKKEWNRIASSPGGESVTVIHKANGESEIIDHQEEQLIRIYRCLDGEDRSSLVRHGGLLASQPKYLNTPSDENE